MALVFKGGISHHSEPDDELSLLPDNSGSIELADQLDSSSSSSPSPSNLNHEKDNLKEKTFWQWFCHKPWTKLPFLYFVIGAIGTLALVIFHFMDADTAFLVSGGVYITLCIFGVKHFYTLMNLKEQVDTFGNLNVKFRKEHVFLQQDIGKIASAREALQETQLRIHYANEVNRENLNQFRMIQANMEKYALHSVEQLTTVKQKADSIANRWRNQLMERERDLLHTVFDRFETQTTQRGMTREDFAAFELQLPPSYKSRFDRLGTFRTLCGDHTHIDFNKFDVALDVFATMEADNVDIDFEVMTASKTRANTKANAGNAHVDLAMHMSDEKSESFDIENISKMKQWRLGRADRTNLKSQILIKSVSIPAQHEPSHIPQFSGANDSFQFNFYRQLSTDASLHLASPGASPHTSARNLMMPGLDVQQSIDSMASFSFGKGRKVSIMQVGDLMKKFHSARNSSTMPDVDLGAMLRMASLLVLDDVDDDHQY